MSVSVPAGVTTPPPPPVLLSEAGLRGSVSVARRGQRTAWPGGLQEHGAHEHFPDAWCGTGTRQSVTGISVAVPRVTVNGV